MVVDTSQQRRGLLPGVTEYILLSVIERKGPIHGSGIVKDVVRDTDGYFRLKEGTLYPALNRLEEDDLLTSRWENERSRSRRCYSITGQGREALEKMHIQWQQFSTAVNRVYGSKLVANV